MVNILIPLLQTSTNALLYIKSEVNTFIEAKISCVLRKMWNLLEEQPWSHQMIESGQGPRWTFLIQSSYLKGWLYLFWHALSEINCLFKSRSEFDFGFWIYWKKIISVYSISIMAKIRSIQIFCLLVKGNNGCFIVLYHHQLSYIYFPGLSKSPNLFSFSFISMHFFWATQTTYISYPCPTGVY